tara:strand:+ start:1872 stop:2336 length:465 start_codon:yes stop_codon:yes gene_type:complete
MITNLDKITLKNIYEELIIFIISSSAGLLFLTYLINLPKLVTGEGKIVKEYYIERFPSSIIYDFLFIFIYFIIAGIFMRILKAKRNIFKLLIVGLITIILTGYACYYFISRKPTSSFFSRWFHTVKYSSIIYDVILLVFIYYIFLYYKNKLKQI